MGTFLWDSLRIGNWGKITFLTGIFYPSGSFCCVSNSSHNTCN